MTNFNELNSIIEKILKNQHDETDIAVLQQWLKSGNQIVSQQGKYAVNLGQGQEIHIGDLYQGADAEVIREIVQSILEEFKRSGQFAPSQEIPSPPSQQNQKSVDELVQQVRSHIHDDIHRLHSTMPLWGVDHWVPLGDLFVDVNILEELSSSRKSELNDLWQDFSKNPSYRSLDRIGLGKERERISGLEILTKNTNLMVVGKPGSGKTTYLQRVVTECNAGNLQTHRIPALIKLREFVEDGRKFAYSLNAYFEQCWQLSNTEINLILHQGRALVLLDGLDEVTGEDGKNITKQIKVFARSYPQVQVVITCRTQSQESRFERFDYVEVADFNQVQVQLFAEHWFKAVMKDESAGLKRSKEFLSQLFQEENQPIRDLAITPILLGLTCAVFHQTGKFYSKRSKLYEEGLELLLEQWDKSREIERDEIYRDLSPERKLELLSYLAVKKFEQQQYVLFEQAEIEGYIAEFLGIGLQDSRTVLRAIASQHGLLIERSYKVWSFSHLTFQEYLVASVIKEQNAIHKLLNHLNEKHWREVFLLTVQMLHIADTLLQLMKFQIDRLIAKEDKIQQFLQWLNQKASSLLTPYKASAIRAFYFTLAHTNGYTVDRIIPTKNLSSNLFFDFELTRAFVSEDGLNIDFNLARIIDSDFASALGVTHGHGHHPDGDLDIPRTSAIDQALQCVSFSKVVNALKETPNEEIIFKFAFALAWGFALPPYLYKALQEMKDELLQVENLQEPERGELIQIDDMKILVQNSSTLSARELKEKVWWKENRNKWTDKLKNLVNGYCNIGHDWKLSKEEKELLQHYYNANDLLVNCLNSGCNVSQELKHKIEDTLLLPIAEIEKRERETAE